MTIIGKDCITRWNQLRQCYCREHNKLTGKRSGDAAKSYVIWPFYNHMSFLEKFVKKRKYVVKHMYINFWHGIKTVLLYFSTSCNIKRKHDDNDDDDEDGGNDDEAQDNNNETDIVNESCINLDNSDVLDDDNYSLQLSAIPSTSFLHVSSVSAPLSVDSLSSTSLKSEAPKKKHKKGRDNSHEIELLKSLQETSQTLTKTLQNATRPSELGENEHYGMQLAARLDRLLPHQQDFVKLEIEKLLMTAKRLPLPTADFSLILQQWTNSPVWPNISSVAEDSSKTYHTLKNM